MAAERDIDDLPRNDANYTALTPLWFLERAALAQPGRASVVHGPVRYTWADTYRRCRRLASALTRRSVGHGSTVNFSALFGCYFFPPRGLSPGPNSFPVACRAADFKFTRNRMNSVLSSVSIRGNGPDPAI